jgi:hypothetical protein
MSTGTCIICAAKTIALQDLQFNHTYYSCQDCEFIFLDPKCRVSPEAERRRYLEHNNTPDNEGYVKMFRDFIDCALMPYQSRINKALDFGCGPGPVLPALLEEKGWSVDRYDPFFAPHKIYQGRCYDLITATEVFEHLADPLETTSLLKEHLAPKGLLAIMTLFHPLKPEEFLKWWYRRDCTHISFFTDRTFHCLAEILKMRVLRIEKNKICVLEKLMQD